MLGGPLGATINGTVLKRATDATSQVLSTTSPGVLAALNTMEGVFNNFQSSLSSANSIVDPTTGLLAGLNCLIFG